MDVPVEIQRDTYQIQIKIFTTWLFLLGNFVYQHYVVGVPPYF
jgi:hypothetical protein